MLRRTLPRLLRTSTFSLGFSGLECPVLISSDVLSRLQSNEGHYWGERLTILCTSSQLSISKPFTTNKESTGDNSKISQVNSILQKLDAAHFKEVLDQHSERHWNIAYSDLLKLCIQCGAASSEDDAVQICDALDKSGVVLRVKDLIYLRPLEVAEIIYQALPDTDKELKSRLNQLKLEIEPMYRQKRSIDNHAHRVSRAILWTGLLFMVGQWSLFARLTFWELSWDVMEPITYFTGAAFGIAVYAYYLWYNEEFGIHTARERIHTSVQDQTYARKGFDKERFHYLLRRIHRLESSLSSIAPLKHDDQSAETSRT